MSTWQRLGDKPIMPLEQAMQIAEQNQGHPVEHNEMCTALSVLRAELLAIQRRDTHAVDIYGNGVVRGPEAACVVLQRKLGELEQIKAVLA